MSARAMRKIERDAQVALWVVAVAALALGAALVLSFGFGALLMALILAGFVILVAAGLWDETAVGPVIEWLLPVKGRWARALVAAIGLVLSFGVLLYLAVAPVFGLPSPWRW